MLVRRGCGIAFISLTVILAAPMSAIGGPARRNLDVPSSDTLKISMTCTHFGATQTKELVGPNGINASLVVFTGDDYAKESHQCQSAYFVKFIPNQGSNGLPYAGFFGSDNGWDRPLTARLDGFSPDGTRAFGVINEGGENPFAFVFAEPRHALGDDLYITKELRLLKPLKCGSSFQVAGTTHDGAIVIEPDSEKECHTKFRWKIIAKDSSLKPLTDRDDIIPLFKGPIDK